MSHSTVTNRPPMNAAAEAPTLNSLFRASEHRQNLCVLTVLTWIASCDGTIDPEELEFLRTVAAGVPDGQAELPAVVEIARLGRPDDLELACRYLRNHAARSERPLLAQLFVTMAARDGQLTVAENHVLRFLADLLGLSPHKFNKLFEEVTHRPFPEVGDVSSLQWWKRREAGKQAAAPADGWGREATGRRAPAGAAHGGDGRQDGGATGHGDATESSSGGPMTRARALLMFGLDEGASRDAIHSAYRRLAKARHPDRFARLGPAAQAAASAAFVTVQEAYTLLSSSAAIA